MMRLVAGLIREPDLEGRGPDHAEKWRSIAAEFRDLLGAGNGHDVEGYAKPMHAYDVSIRGMDKQDLQLLALLQHFPAVQNVPIAVVRTIWDAVWQESATSVAQGRGSFDASLKRMQRMNIIDIYQHDYHGLKYGVSRLSEFLCSLDCVQWGNTF